MNPVHRPTQKAPADDRPFYEHLDDNAISNNTSRWEEEHFIPVARADWRVLMTDLATNAGITHTLFEQFCALLDALVHMRSYHANAELSENYSHVDPDCINDHLLREPRDNKPADRGKLVIDQLDEVMLRANYQKLSRHELLVALKKASEFGMPMTVDFSVFKRIGVYVRGKLVSSRRRRRMANFYRVEEVEMQLFQRLVICFQLTENAADGNNHRHDRLYIKSFKNIPRHDIDMLLPGTTARMSLLDRGKIVLPTLSGLGILTFRLFFVVSMGLFAFLSLLFTTTGYAAKSIFGYLRTKDKYQHNLTRNLYYQNLGNNAGVLQQLQNEAEEQEIQECLLAYTMLLVNHPQGATARTLDESAERFIEKAVAFQVDFEVDDALRKLVHLRLVSINPDRHFVAAKVPQAIETLKYRFAELVTGD